MSYKPPRIQNTSAEYQCKKLGAQKSKKSEKVEIIIQKIETYTEQEGYVFTKQEVVECDSKDYCGIKITHPSGAIDYDWKSCDACQIFNKSGSP